MKIVILHDQRRTELIQPLLFQLERQHIYEYDIIHPVWADTVEKSINLSHKKIVRHAQEEQAPEVCVMESDVWFPSETAWSYFLSKKPEEFDIYLAGVYAATPVDGKVTRFAGMHCYIVNSRFYDTFLSLPEDKHIDDVLAGKGLYYVCYPYAAIQRPGWSANNKAEVNYNDSLKPEDIYHE